MTTSLRLTAVAALGLLAACSTGSGPSTSTQVTFSLASKQGAAPFAALTGDTIATATDTLIIDRVELVLRDIRFKRVNDNACDLEDEDSSGVHASPVAFSHDGGDDDGHDGEADGCESFNAGPFLLDLPLGAGTAKAFAVAVDTGTYDQVRIKVHKPEDDSGDPKDIAFLAAHPDFNKVSIRVTGSFNGTPFTFETDRNAEERFTLVPPLVVADSTSSVDVTIQVDVAAWFQDGAGGVIDPGTANKGGANDQLVEDNIKDSFKAFRDENHDGHDDDGNDDD